MHHVQQLTLQNFFSKQMCLLHPFRLPIKGIPSGSSLKANPHIHQRHESFQFVALNFLYRALHKATHYRRYREKDGEALLMNVCVHGPAVAHPSNFPGLPRGVGEDLFALTSPDDFNYISRCPTVFVGVCYDAESFYSENIRIRKFCCVIK